MVDAADSKSAAARRVGSSPTLGTNFPANVDIRRGRADRPIRPIFSGNV